VSRGSATRYSSFAPFCLRFPRKLTHSAINGRIDILPVTSKFGTSSFLLLFSCFEFFVARTVNGVRSARPEKRLETMLYASNVAEQLAQSVMRDRSRLEFCIKTARSKLCESVFPPLFDVEHRRR
jgi:hypothetical protein